MIYINSALPSLLAPPSATKSTCGAVELLAAIFCEDSDALKRRFGLPTRMQLSMQPCLECGTLAVLTRLGYCGRKCWSQSRRVWLVCDNCGTLFRTRYGSEMAIRIGKMGQQHIFCGRPCFGQWLGRHYGFAAHPENCGPGERERRRKWDYEEVWRLQDETGWGAYRISRRLGIPTTSVSLILSKRVKSPAGC